AGKRRGDGLLERCLLLPARAARPVPGAADGTRKAPADAARTVGLALRPTISTAHNPRPRRARAASSARWGVMPSLRVARWPMHVDRASSVLTGSSRKRAKHWAALRKHANASAPRLIRTADLPIRSCRHTSPSVLIRRNP